MSRIYKEDSQLNLNRSIQHSYSPLQYNQMETQNYPAYSQRNLQNDINTPVRRVSITHHSSSIDRHNSPGNQPVITHNLF